jgi:hypothetical protein
VKCYDGSQVPIPSDTTNQFNCLEDLRAVLELLVSAVCLQTSYRPPGIAEASKNRG